MASLTERDMEKIQHQPMDFDKKIDLADLDTIQRAALPAISRAEKTLYGKSFTEAK